MAQGHDCSDLDRLKHPVVEIRLDPGERRDHGRIADAETDAPARHAVRLGEAEELHADLLGSGHLQQRGSPVAVERQVGIREVVDDEDGLRAREVDDALEELALDREARRVVRK